MKALAPEIGFSWGRLMGGIGFYTYQISLGFSLRYWPCLRMPTIRIHAGPFKFWIGFCFKRGGNG